MSRSGSITKLREDLLTAGVKFEMNVNLIPNVQQAFMSLSQKNRNRRGNTIYTLSISA